ncbi:DNAL1 protein, partial [Acromyrmex heyeri]
AKATTCKEAIQRWEDKTGLIASEQKEIILSFQWPPIERMDNSLAILNNVEFVINNKNICTDHAFIKFLSNIAALYELCKKIF